MNIRKTTAHGAKRKLSVKLPTPAKQREPDFQWAKRVLNLVSTNADVQFTLGILLGFAISAGLFTGSLSSTGNGKTTGSGSKKIKSPLSSAASKKKKSKWQDPEDLCDAED